MSNLLTGDCQSKEKNEWKTTLRELLLGQERFPCLVIKEDANLSYLSLWFVNIFHNELFHVFGCRINTLHKTTYLRWNRWGSRGRLKIKHRLFRISRTTSRRNTFTFRHIYIHRTVTEEKPVSRNAGQTVLDRFDNIKRWVSTSIENSTKGGGGDFYELSKDLLGHMLTLHNASDSIFHLLENYVIFLSKSIFGLKIGKLLSVYKGKANF